MALEEKVVIDKIEVLQDGQIQIRQATLVLKDGKEIAKTYHRWVKAPGDDVSDQTDRVKSVANAVWTEDVKKKYKEKKNEPTDI